MQVNAMSNRTRGKGGICTKGAWGFNDRSYDHESFPTEDVRGEVYIYSMIDSTSPVGSIDSDSRTSRTMAEEPVVRR